MKLKVLKPDDPLLRTPCEEVSIKELRSKQTQEIIEQLLNFMYGASHKGEDYKKGQVMVVGLSANQVGVNKKICIVDLAIGHKEYNDLLVLVNPKILKLSPTKSKHREGCVNLPKIYGLVDRHRAVKVKAWDRSGNEIIINAKGWLSVLLQHEIGHLNGHLFIDYLEDPKKAAYVPDNKAVEYKSKFKNWKHFKDVSNLVK